jgi:predicted acylesterase/phospholipase RssA
MTLAALLGVSQVDAQTTGKCHALALSSGDEAAAYQAGALKGIVSSPELNATDWAYDSVSGVSGGALNAVLMASFEKGDEVNAVDRMEKFWTDASNTKLYKNWLGGITRGLFFEGGLYNSAPLEDFLKKEFTNLTMHRKLDIGIVDVLDGSYKDFSDTNVTQGENLVDAMYASMSFAGFFPPADVLGSSWFDGSAVWDIDIFSAINRCTDLGFKNEDIIVDVIMTSSANLKDVQAEDYKSIGMLFRYLEISSFYNSMDGLLRAKFAYNGVDFRWIISPSGSIPSSIYPLNMSTKQVDDAFTMGMKDAEAVIKNGTHSSLDNVIHYHALKKSGNPSIMKHTYGSFTEAKQNGEFEDYNIHEDPYMRKYTVMAK